MRNDGLLLEAAKTFATPLYVYDVDELRQRFDNLHTAFDNRFSVSFAVKSNPNTALLASMRDKVVTFDVSSLAEAERALNAGTPAEKITFSGPAKKKAEIERAVALGIGELVIESLPEAVHASKTARQLGLTQNILVRMNPMNTPRDFGVNMAGKPSQFGIDEEVLEDAIAALLELDGLHLKGFHIYSGTNSLNAEAIAENFAIFTELFRKASDLAGIAPEKLVFGSGFGLPYLPSDTALDIELLASLVNPMVDDFIADPRFANADLVLEMGRWLVGPVGWLLSSVVAAKHSRGTNLRLCDAGFNNHLAACGMMGSVIRRNWRIYNISGPDRPTEKYTLNGPLCTTIDVLATNIELPQLEVDDVIAIENSGAYGLTASPTRFISHPEPREVIVKNGEFSDVTESLLNHWGNTPERLTGIGVAR